MRGRFQIKFCETYLVILLIIKTCFTLNQHLSPLKLIIKFVVKFSTNSLNQLKLYIHNKNTNFINENKNSKNKEKFEKNVQCVVRFLAIFGALAI